MGSILDAQPDTANDQPPDQQRIADQKDPQAGISQHGIINVQQGGKQPQHIHADGGIVDAGNHQTIQGGYIQLKQHRKADHGQCGQHHHQSFHAYLRMR
jgi:hypothetical protein